jgi:hypothetical protein
MAEPTPTARLFLPDTAGFDAARYAPEASGTSGASPAPSPDAGEELDWTGAVASLERAQGLPIAPAPTSAPRQVTALVPPAKEGDKNTGSRPFYTSPWFWGALGAAALGGTALYFATRDNSSGTIHLQLQVPK